MIFNTSMPRAGSELLQVILHQNPRIYASPTSPLLEYQFGARGNYDLAEVRAQDPALMQKAFIAGCRGWADAYYAAITDRPVIVDKNRGWSHYFEWVEQWHPEPKMICMVRDLRGILASMERIFRANRHRPAGPDNPQKMQSMTVGQRVRAWLDTQPIGLALRRTHDLFQRGIADRILFVRYEDLCLNPEKELAHIYAFIGEEPFAHDFSNIVKEVAEDDSHFGVYGAHGVGRHLSTQRVNSWREILPEEVAAGIRREWAWYFDVFKY